MDKQNSRNSRVKNGGKILIWLGLLIFFVYSYQAVIDLEPIGHPRRQESVVRMLTTLTKPNFFEYEYETRETPVVLEKDCQNSDGPSQIEQVSDGTIIIDLECTSALVPIYTFRGSGLMPNTTGYIAWDSSNPDVDDSFTTSSFFVDGEGNFLITDIPPYRETVVSGHIIVVVEQLNKTLRGFSEVSHRAAEKMWETIQIAFLATSISAILAILLTFLSARASSFWARAFYILLQIVTAIIHAVHPLIIVIPAIVLVGIGPTAGVLALTLFSTVVLVVTFSEYAQQHTSLNWSTLLKVHFQGLAFRYLSANLLIATVLGFMGGGGIGFLIQQDINLLNYRDAGVAIFASIISISSLDLLSRIVWRRIQITGDVPSTHS